MIYAYIALAVALFGGGFATAKQFDAAEILRLETAIERGNAQAETELRLAQVKVAHETEKAAQLNQQIEITHAQQIQTVNALTDRVADSAKRLYASRQNCANAVSTGSNPRVSETEAADRYGRAVGATVADVKIADAYAQSCWRIVSHNCGITHDGPLLPD